MRSLTSSALVGSSDRSMDHRLHACATAERKAVDENSLDAHSCARSATGWRWRIFQDVDEGN